MPCDNLTNVYSDKSGDLQTKMKLDTLLWVSFDRGPPALCRCPNCRAFVIGGEEGCGNNLSPEPASVPSWGKRGEGERRQGRRGRGFGAVWPPLGSNSYPLPPMDLPPPHGEILPFETCFSSGGKSCTKLSRALLYLEGNSLGFGSAGKRLVFNFNAYLKLLDCLRTIQGAGRLLTRLPDSEHCSLPPLLPGFRGIHQ